MTFILNIINPLNNAFQAQQAIASQNLALVKAKEAESEETKSSESKEETKSSDLVKDDKAQVKKPPLSTAEITAKKHTAALGKLVDSTAKNYLLDQNMMMLVKQIIQNAPLQEAQNIQRATKPALNAGITNFVATEVYKLFEDEEKKKKDKASPTSFRDRFKSDPGYSEDIFDTAKFIVGTIKRYGDFDFEKIDLNGSDSQEARKAFENLNDPEKLILVTTVLQEATDYFMQETSNRLGDPLQSVQATANYSLSLAKAVTAAEKKTRQMAYTLDKYENLGIRPLGMA